MIMKSNRILLAMAVTALVAGCSNQRSQAIAIPRTAEREAAPDPRPNIILILADDLGFSDLGSFGGEIRTPHLDSLAVNGIRFTEFYNTSRCCPTRASLLTGLYNQQAGIGEMTTDRGLPGYRGHLTENTVTLAEVLGAAGYSTGMTGKWHVSNTIEQPDRQAQLRWLNHQEQHPLFAPIEQYPTNRGFERYFGNIWGVVDFFDPFSLVSGTTPITTVPAGYYHTDAINDTAAAYVREFSKRKQPFFLYVAQTAPHWPLQAPEGEVRKYEDVYKAGWDAIREQRYRRQVQLGLIDSTTCKLSPRLNRNDWRSNPNKEWDARAMAVHAAMIDRMDQGIGRLIDALRETGELDNTLIVFLSDNGASPENAMRYGPGFDRPSQTRSGQRIAYPVNKDVMPGPQTCYASIGEDWANVANTPYRYAKAESFEGGVHTPMIACWPTGISRKGVISKRVSHVMDFMSTFAELGRASYPKTYGGRAITPGSGTSLVQELRGRPGSGHTELYNEHFGARSAREGDWKLVSLAGDTTWRLYDLRVDASETKDLAASRPDLVQRLCAKWRAWAFSHAVLPKQDP